LDTADRDTSTMVIFFTILLGLVTVIFLKWKLAKPKNLNIPKPFWYPLQKDKNFKWITENVRNGTLPKMFQPEVFTYLPISHIFSGAVIISDFDLIKEAFRAWVVSL